MKSARDEERLCARANQGDAGALAELYRAHAGWVFAIARRFTGSREDALDVTHEVFLRFFMRFPGFERRASLRSFLYPMVKHRALDALRSRRRTAPLEHEPRPLAPPEEPRDFERLIKRLPEPLREVVRLRYQAGLRLDEIAELQGLPAGTVKSRLHRAMTRLRRAHRC